MLQRWNDGGETKYLKGMLKIVDLAGSERVSKTESNGNRLEEAKRINKEITTLGKCINLLAQAEKENKTLSSVVLFWGRIRIVNLTTINPIFLTEILKLQDTYQNLCRAEPKLFFAFAYQNFQSTLKSHFHPWYLPPRPALSRWIRSETTCTRCRAITKNQLRDLLQVYTRLLWDQRP